MASTVIAVSTYVTVVGSVALDARAAAVFEELAGEWFDEFDVRTNGDVLVVTFPGNSHRNLRGEQALITSQLAGTVDGYVSIECTDGSNTLTLARFSGHDAIGGVAGCLRKSVEAGPSVVVALNLGRRPNQGDGSLSNWDGHVLSGSSAFEMVLYEWCEHPVVLHPMRPGAACSCGGYDEDDENSRCVNASVADIPVSTLDRPISAHWGLATAHDTVVRARGLIADGASASAVVDALEAVPGAYARPVWPVWNMLLDTARGTAAFDAIAVRAPAGLIRLVAAEWATRQARSIVPWSLLACTCSSSGDVAFSEQLARWSAMADRFGADLLHRWARLRIAGMPDCVVPVSASFDDLVAVNVDGLVDLSPASIDIAATLFADAVADGHLGRHDRDSVLDAAAAIRDSPA